MCNHGNTIRVNDVRVCLKCGMTLTYDGKVLFDKRITNYKQKRHKKRG